ncbi:hypothetical protein TNCV_4838181 [Trichonephila clavipes]|nr:hypothetical protein TNCV_4838181 [Trichonephila clavipes]
MRNGESAGRVRVLIVELLAALSWKFGSGFRGDRKEHERTQRSEPVSTRNCFLDNCSVTRRQLLPIWQLVVAVTGYHERFPKNYKDLCRSYLFPENVDDSNTILSLQYYARIRRGMPLNLWWNELLKVLEWERVCRSFTCLARSFTLSESDSKVTETLGDAEATMGSINITEGIGGRGSRVVRVSDRGLPCHEFEPSTTKDPPCRAAMHAKSAES